jgi:hypothetical protein
MRVETTRIGVALTVAAVLIVVAVVVIVVVPGGWASSTRSHRVAGGTAAVASPPSAAAVMGPGTSGMPCTTPPGYGVALVSPVPQDGPKVLAQADSVWLDGSVTEHGCLLDPLFVFTARNGNTPVIGEYVEDAITATVAARYNRVYTSPRAIGRLTITGVKGQLVRFRSGTGVTGSFDFDTRTWSFE